MSYLQHLRHRDLKHATTLSHVSAFSSCMNKVDGVPVGWHPLVARWILGDRSQNPPRRYLVPPWDLSVVLAAITEKLLSLYVRLRLLMLKTLFLLAAASAHRIFELHALCIKPPFLMQNPHSFRLTPKPAFLPKTSTEVALSLNIELSSFYQEPYSPLERGLHLMCPVHGLYIYLQCTVLSRSQNRGLFVPWDEGRGPPPY